MLANSHDRGLWPVHFHPQLTGVLRRGVAPDFQIGSIGFALQRKRFAVKV
jgi:hypothetical protein